MPRMGSNKVVQGRTTLSFGAIARALLLASLSILAMNARGMPSPLPLANAASTNSMTTEVSNFRVRVSQQRSRAFTITGTNIAVGDLSPTRGYAAYRIEKLSKAGETTWVISDRDSKKWIANISARSLELNGTNLRIGLKPMPNQIEVESRGPSSSDVIATLDIETYLKGVLPAEMPASWPLEALKAQAVAARTFAIFRREQRLKSDDRDFDLESDVMDQMFRSPLSGDQPLLRNVDLAIEETKGEILEDQRQNAFATYFHADCGGQTEEAKDVWGSGEKLGTAKDAACPLNPRASWTLKMSSAEMSRRVAKSLGRAADDSKLQIASLRTTDHTSSGRAREMLVAWSNGESQSINGNEFRRALGFDELKSTHFSLSHVGPDYIFKGQGYGHGVGLCQWGARQMAKLGQGYQEILNHYYPKARLIGRAGRLDRQVNLDDKERNRTNHKQVAQFH